MQKYQIKVQYKDYTRQIWYKPMTFEQKQRQRLQATTKRLHQPI